MSVQSHPLGVRLDDIVSLWVTSTSVTKGRHYFRVEINMINGWQLERFLPLAQFRRILDHDLALRHTRLVWAFDGLIHPELKHLLWSYPTDGELLDG